MWRAHRANKSKALWAPEEIAEHEVEDEALLILRTPDGRAGLSDDTTEEATSELLPLVVELNQDTAQKILSEEIPEDWDKEAVKVLEETPKVQGR